MSSQHFQTAITNLRNNYAKVRMMRKERQIKVIDYIDPNVKKVMRPNVNVMYCQATTMSGNRCKFKATCGKFCKKHKI